jgi:hypothetical protein
MIVSKDIHSSHPPSGTQAGPPSILTRSGTLKAESSIGSEDDLGRLPGREKETQKSDFTAKADNADNIFIEDVSVQDGQWKPIRSNASLVPFLRSFQPSTSISEKLWFEPAS